MSSILDDIKEGIFGRKTATMQIIMLCVVVFAAIGIVRVLLQLSGFAFWAEWITRQLSMPASLSAFVFKPWTLISYFFYHEGVFHIFFNMLWLYYIGHIVEEYLGKKRVINLFVLGGVFGGIFYILLYNIIPVLADKVPVTILLGASGGVYAVVCGAATLLPDYRLNLLFFGSVKLTYIALAYVLISFLSLPSTNTGGNLAHLGGALIGYLYIKGLRSGTDLGKPIEFILDFFSNLFRISPKFTIHKNDAVFGKQKTNSYSYNEKRNTGSKAISNSRDWVSEDEINSILDKINETGYDSLSKEEKQKLFKAGQDSN